MDRWRKRPGGYFGSRASVKVKSRGMSGDLSACHVRLDLAIRPTRWIMRPALSRAPLPDLGVRHKPDRSRVLVAPLRFGWGLRRPSSFCLFDFACVVFRLPGRRRHSHADPRGRGHCLSCSCAHGQKVLARPMVSDAWRARLASAILGGRSRPVVTQYASVVPFARVSLGIVPTS
jgi:hypothetical protein